ncbi:MAG: hypothetical protein BAJALOKI1v1_1230010 [Promethearchaeota archaeon]|nr:MAG: hypothetical protein BAJALOKI1v1_1230010 [Candidatus Lokiarchaeota archaeon]
MSDDKLNYYEFASQIALPFLGSHETVLKDIFKHLQKKFNLQINSNQKFIDLGSGNGTVIIYCALKCAIKSVGVEINSNLVKETEDRIKNLKENNEIGDRELMKRLDKIEVVQSDLFTITLEAYDFIYIFSLPTMQRYLKHIFQTARQDAVIISYKYPLEHLPLLKKVSELTTSIYEQILSTYFYQRV